jgi:hypothetical protein
MFPCGFFSSGTWWVFPILMIAMVFLCLFLMRRMCGTGTGMNCRMKSGAGHHDADTRRGSEE